MKLKNIFHRYYRLLLAVGVFYCSIFTLFAQKTEFEKLFKEATEQQYNNPRKSLELYSYLLKSYSDQQSQFRIYLEALHTYQILEEYSLAVETIQKLHTLQSEITNKEWLFRCWLESTSLYNNLDLSEETEKSKLKLLSSFELLSTEQKEKNQKHLDVLLISIENPSEIIEKVQRLKRIQMYYSPEESRYAWLSYRIADLYYDIEKDSSLHYFGEIQSLQNHFLSPLVAVYKDGIEQRSWNQNFILNQVLKNENLSKRLKIQTLQRLLSYKEINAEPKQIVLFTEALDRLKKESLLEKRQAKALLLEATYYRNKDLASLQKEKHKKTEYLSIALLSFSLLIYIAYWFFRRKKQLAKAKSLSEKESQKVKGIPSKTEEEILRRLEVFEKSTLYLDKQLRIATLAKHLKTNTRYLSKVLNERKNKSFNNYINHLRINYIVDKLKNEPIYRSYKISYLAKESGFASQSSFSTSFKEVERKSPSTYIKELSDKK